MGIGFQGRVYIASGVEKACARMQCVDDLSRCGCRSIFIAVVAYGSVSRARGDLASRRSLMFR